MAKLIKKIESSNKFRSKFMTKYQQGGKAAELKLDMDTKEITDALLVALAEEFNAWFQYIIVFPYLYGNERTQLVEMFKEQAEDELEDHAYWIMERLNQLGAEPDKVIAPDMWNRTAAHKYIVPAFDVKTAIAKNIEAEKGAIETYAKIEKLTRDKDVVTNRKVKEILEDEQEHLQNLIDIQKDLG